MNYKFIVLYPIKMDIPLHLRPKLRYLANCLRNKKCYPKSIYSILDSDFFEHEKSNLVFIPQKECSENLTIFCEKILTNNIGFGIFAKQNLQPNEYLGCYLGTLEENPKMHLAKSFKEISYNFSSPFSGYCVNGLKNGNYTAFFNHSDYPNVSTKVIVHESEIHTAFFTKKYIKKGEQLFIDYGDEYWESAEAFGINKITCFSYKNKNK